MKSAISAAIAAIFFSSDVAHASGDLQLRGKYGACWNNQKMGLWDLSSNSPLIRDDMLKSSYCWLTAPGIRVVVIDNVGKFARVTNKEGSREYLVYRSDIEVVPTEIEVVSAEKAKAIDKSDHRIDKIQLLSVRNTVQGEVYDIGGKPTVQIDIKVDSKLSLDFSIVKSEIVEGFDVKIENQKNSKMQVGGKCAGETVGVGGLDFYRVKVASLDSAKKRATFLISGKRNMCSLDLRHGYLLSDVALEISGKNFTEMMRPHTDKELAKRFVPFKW